VGKPANFTATDSGGIMGGEPDPRRGERDHRERRPCVSGLLGKFVEMNAPFHTTQQLPVVTLPAEFESLAPPPLLLPGEKLEQYQMLRQAIFADIAPRSAIEWLLAIDVVELSWEIQRYRLLRHKVL
jgi:hypothetical protein